MILFDNRDQINGLASTRRQSYGDDEILGTSFIKRLEALKKDNSEWRAECRKWQNDLVNAIYTDNRNLEQRGGSIDGYLRRDAQITHRQLLEELRFSEMRDRDDRIAEAYEKTFTWIFDESDSWMNFANWLRRGSGVYWITGKPGCGKSTLMKYICLNQRTKELLTHWSSPLPLVTASFYLWNSGAEIQMSQDGLLRSLLFQVLNQAPETLPVLFPERWELASFFQVYRGQITSIELRDALARLISVKSFKFCFFIDGLDEFRGDPIELASLAAELTTSSNIKLCTASRPWNIFEESFKAKPSLLLQMLTYKDIKYFVSSNFQKDLNFAEFRRHQPESAHHLIESIVDKAAGVFLWVHLVVTSLLAGLRNGDRVTDLQKRLDLLPQDLQTLYEKILQSLDPFYFEHALQYFQLVKCAPSPLTLLDFSFADEESDFIFNCEFGDLSSDEKRYRAETMRRRLNSRCKGLLEVAYETEESIPETQSRVIPGQNLDICSEGARNDATIIPQTSGLLSEITDASRASSTVQYLHRTVKDFLEDEQKWSSLVGSREWTFDANMVLCRSLIAQFKDQPVEKSVNRVTLEAEIKKILRQAYRCEGLSTEISFGRNYRFMLQAFDQAAQILTQSTLDHFLRNESQPGHWPSEFGGGGWPRTEEAEDCRFCANAPLPKDSSFLSVAVSLHLKRFVQAEIESLSQNRPLESISHLLPYASNCNSLVHIVLEGPSVPLSLDMVRLLFSNGADPNQKIGKTTIWKKFIREKWRLLDPSKLTQPPNDEILREFLEHGAENPIRSKLSSSYGWFSSKGPLIRIDVKKTAFGGKKAHFQVLRPSGR